MAAKGAIGMQTATVAGCTMELHGCDAMHHADKLRRFPSDGGAVDICLRVERDVPFACPKETPLVSTAVSRTFAENDGRRTAFRADHKMSLSYDTAFSDITLRLSPQTPEVEARQYLSVLQCFSYHLLTKGGSLLHSAGMAFGADGVALVGRSQVGKSTMARHCRRLDPTMEIVCEDAPAVVKHDGGFLLCGTPFCGDDEACADLSVPLRGLVVLTQARHNRVTTLSPREAMFHLLEAVPRPLFDDRASELAVTLVTEWIGGLPILHFENDGSEQAGELLLSTLSDYGWIAERTTHA